MSIEKNLYKNGIATGVQKIVRITEQLLLVPFFISAWGAEYYGEWLTLTIIPTMLSFSDFGFGTSIANKFILQYANGEKRDAANTYKTGFVIISLVVVCSMFLSLIVLIVLNYYEVFDRSLINKTDAITAISLLMCSRIVYFYVLLFEAKFRAARKAALSINYMNAYAIANIFGGLFVLFLGWGVVMFALMTLIVILIFVPVFAWKAEKTLGLSKEFKGEFLKTEVRDLTSKGLSYLMLPIWQSIYFQGSTFVVRLVFGPTFVTVFNTMRTLVRSVIQVYNMINWIAFPEMQFEYGRGNLHRTRQLFRINYFIAIAIAIIGVVLLIVFGMSFYVFWTGSLLSISNDIWYLFVSGILLNALWFPFENVFRATNKPFLFAIVGVFSALFSVFSSYFLSIIYGFNGAVIGFLLLDVILVLFCLPIGCKLIRQPLSSLLTDFLENDLFIVYAKCKFSFVSKSKK